MSVDRTNSAQQLSRNPRTARILSGFLLAIVFLLQGTAPVRAQSAASNKWTVTIILPAKVVAGRPATLAVLGVDGRLASDVTLDLGGGQRVVTDATGRASFTAPSAGSVLIAKGSGSSTAALVDANPPENPKDAIWAAPEASLHEPFSICGSRFRSDADANHVRLNGEAALVMASSPECLSVMPGPEAATGPAEISIQTASGQWTAHTTLVSLEPQFPQSGSTAGSERPVECKCAGDGSAPAHCRGERNAGHTSVPERRCAGVADQRRQRKLCVPGSGGDPFGRFLPRCSAFALTRRKCRSTIPGGRCSSGGEARRTRDRSARPRARTQPSES